MNAPAAIKATFADYKRIRTRKLGQLIFEIPLEHLHDAIETLGGEPSVEGDTWVAIARLIEGAGKVTEAKGLALTAAASPVTQAALTCQREAFWKYLRDVQDAECESEDDAADFVRKHCGIKSRSLLTPKNEAALQKWWELSGSFNDWMGTA